MKIALVNTYMHGGAGNACQRLAQALLHTGAQATIISRSEATAEYIQPLRGWPAWQAKAGFYLERLSFLPHEKSKAIRFSYSLANFGANISKLPAIQDADIINIHWINQGFLSLNSLKQLGKLGKPIVWTMHDMWPFTGGCHYAGTCEHFLKQCGHCTAYLKNPKQKDLSHKIWQRKAQLYPQLPLAAVTPSTWLRDVAKSSSLFKDIEVRAIPNAIDTQAFRPIDFREARSYFGLPQDKQLALFMAMNVDDTRKGFRYLKESLEALDPEQVPNLELLVAGKAEEASLQGLPFKVHYLGSLSGSEPIMHAYNAANFFIIPSLEDNLPNTIMESLACGRPVLGFRTGGIPDMVIHKETGFLADYKDAQALAQGMLYLYQNANTLEDSCRAKVEKDYSFEKIAKTHLRFFEELILQK